MPAPRPTKFLTVSVRFASGNIPRLYKDTYTDKVGGFRLVYSPLSAKGLVVLNREASFLFSQIDNQKTLADILALAKKEDSKVTFADIARVFKNFSASEIVYFEKPKSETKLFSEKTKHLGVWLHMTNQCNLRCSYCYVSKASDKMSDETAKKSVEQIIKSAEKHGLAKITFKFSGGECLLELPKVLDLASLARKLAGKARIETDFIVLTNGVLLSQKTARVLKKENIRASVSLDGLGKYHDAQRIFPGGKGSFKHVEKGIKNLQKAKVPFNVSVTITSENVENIPELTRYLLDRNIPFAFNFYRENPYVKERLEGNDQKLVGCLKKAYQIIGNDPPRYCLVNGLLDRVVFKKPHLHTCGMGNNYLVIRQDGRLVSCQMTLKKPIGSVDDEDLIETMKRGSFVRPKGLTVEGKRPCQNCRWKYICGGGCPLLTFKQKGRYDVSSPYCAVYRALIPEALRVEAKRLIKYGSRAAEDQEQDVRSPFVL